MQTSDSFFLAFCKETQKICGKSGNEINNDEVCQQCFQLYLVATEYMKDKNEH
jgi:hypothetical protein